MFINKKETMKTMIGTEDREFKRSIINLMNAIAFGAEKLTAKTVDNIDQQTSFDKNIVNIIVSGKELLKDDFDKNVETLVKISKLPHVMMLLVLDAGQMEKYAKREEQPDNIFITSKLSKTEFSNIFHNRNKDKAAPVPISKPAAAPAKKAPNNLLAMESSGHVKATIAWLNDISSDPKDIEKVRMIGQRFNGFVGGMAFLGHKTGWYQLRNLALLVDDLCRIYDEGTTATEVTQDHLYLLVDAAKCSFFILRDLRNNKPITKDYLMMTDEVIKRAQDQNILKEHNDDQAEVDNIFDDLSAAT